MHRTWSWIIVAVCACGGSSGRNDTSDAASHTHDAASSDGGGAAATCTPTGSHAALVDVAAGTTSCALYANGHVACWGLGTWGQLGDGQATHSACSATDTIDDCSFTPVTVSGLTDAIAIAVGGDNACALHSDGTVSCWGDGSYGALGDGVAMHATTCDFTDCSRVPVTVSGLTDAVAISVNVANACALRRNGDVVCWGSNQQGQLGDGVTTHDSCGTPPSGPVDCSRVPVTVANLGDAAAVSVGDAFACARQTDGGAVCWGGTLDSTLGELGDGSLTGSSTPVAVSGLTDAAAIDGGSFNACALHAGGGVACWGWDDTGMLGDGSAMHPTCAGAQTGCSSTPVTVTDLSDARVLTASWSHACAVRAGGAVVCWGDDSYGELGDGGPPPETSPGPMSNTPLTVANVTAPVAVSAGSFSTCSMAADCTVSCWGFNADGQLGDGTTTDRSTAVTVLGL